MLGPLHSAHRWLTHDLWRFRIRQLPRPKAFLLHRLRILVLTLRVFSNSRAALQASALTYFTLLSLVPVLAVFFGIAKGFGLAERAEAEIMRQTRGQEEAVTRIIGWAQGLIDQAPGGLIAGIGTAVLLFAVVKLLTHVEHAFNAIYSINRNRPLIRKFADYLATMIIAPIFIAAAGAATVAINSQVEALFAEAAPSVRTFQPYVHFILQLIPFLLLWFPFTFLYVFMPYTRINWSSAITAGFLAAALFQIVQWAYVTFQIGVARYSAIYGSLAALPLFLVWLQWSWMVILLGACLAYAHQHVGEYRYEPDTENMSHAHRRRLILLVAHWLSQRFEADEQPLTADQIADNLDLPEHFVEGLLNELVQAGLVAETRPHDEKQAASTYLPAHDPNRLTIVAVTTAWENHGTASVPLHDLPALHQIRDHLEKLTQATQKHEANVPLHRLEN